METAFENFFKNRMISTETQILFREWFKKYLEKNFRFNINVFNHLLNSMSIDDINHYWNLFVVDWSKDISNNDKSDT